MKRIRDSNGRFVKIKIVTINMTDLKGIAKMICMVLGVYFLVFLILIRWEEISIFFSNFNDILFKRNSTYGSYLPRNMYVNKTSQEATNQYQPPAFG